MRLESLSPDPLTNVTLAEFGLLYREGQVTSARDYRNLPRKNWGS